MRCLIPFLLAAVLARAQYVPGHYIVELEQEPVAAALPPGPRTTLQDRALRRAEVRREQRRLRGEIERWQAEVLAEVENVANALVVRIPDERAGGLRALPGVRAVHPVRLLQPYLDTAAQLHAAPEAWALAGGVQRAGAGMKIAIIDTGIDASHPAFQDSTLPLPEGFPKVNKESDLAFTNNKVIVARSYPSLRGAEFPAADRKGHGTSVAMAAAGSPVNAPQAAIAGLAPRAWLGNYKVFPDDSEGAPDALILKAIDDAVADGMDVINLSLGSLLAGRPEQDVLARAVERAAAAGVLVVAAAGNDGPDPNTVGTPATATSAISVGNSFNARVFAASVQLEGGVSFVALPAANSSGRGAVSGVLADVAELDGSGLACLALPPGSLAGRIALILRGECTFETKLNNAAAAGAAGALVYSDAARPEAVTMETGPAALPASMVGHAEGLEIRSRLNLSPGLSGTLRFTPGPVPVDPWRISASSSRGPSSNSAIKPELLAAGTSIYTAVPSGGLATGYAVRNGTSFSAPVVAGAAAVLKAARPGLTVEQYRSLLINSATPLAPESGAPVAVQNAGAGLLNLLSGLRATVTAAPAALSFGTGGGTFERSLDLTLTNVGTSADTFSLEPRPLAGGLAATVSRDWVALEPGESATVRVSLAGAGLPGGAYEGFLRVRGTISDSIAHVPYWYAAPTGVARYITPLNPPTSGRAGARLSLIFRVTEESGIPAPDIEPEVAATAGGGEVERVVSIDSQVPGAFRATVRLGPAAGRNTFRIRAAGSEREVTISATQP